MPSQSNYTNSFIHTYIRTNYTEAKHQFCSKDMHFVIKLVIL